MCGICCKLNDTGGSEGECVGAEAAANSAMLTSALPDTWPDPYYRGPNVSVRLCAGAEGACRVAEVRAWPAGGACVALNAVGVCAPPALCKHSRGPRSNLYPDIMSIKLFGKKSSTRLITTPTHLLTSFIAIIFAQ
ncbi:unnamed protein product [Diatraea saccharalis]|uniref:Uncharacterized protein n=1 Tax=Diatraea saccharalis TaxID=40085 RepID=A0A9N9WH51_9NEOP|nr:unnamed protein product [Diatraea saccharalis]